MQITAALAPRTVSLSFGTVTAAATSTGARTLGGVVCRYGIVGRTSAGPLKVAPGALRFPTDLSRVKLTLEHERDRSRGHLVSVEDSPTELRASFKVAEGPEGDDALREALDKTRDGLSFDIIDATISGDTITAGTVIAVGQVGIPAYDDGQVDTIAAAAAPAPTAQPTTAQPGTHREDPPMTPEQTARLTELRALDTLTAEEAAELVALSAAEAADTVEAAPAEDAAPPVAASVAASLPSGVPARRAPARTTPRAGGALRAMAQGITAGLTSRDMASISAALSDVTYSGAGADVAFMPAWSGELWSGLQYEPSFTPLLNAGELTSLKGQGWRWVTKPVMADYAGDKAAIPSAALDTEPSTYTGARMAVGHDIDRAFYDFPDAGFLESYAVACRESWAMKLDDKVEAYLIANAVSIGGAASTSLLKAAARVANRVKRARLGKATFVLVNETDHEGLMDVTEADVPAFLELFGIEPGNFVPSADVAAGTVIAGVKNAGTVRTLPGSPIRADAQHIANGGIDTAFFGYWAIEEHHTSGILKTTWAAA